ncbi:MAG: UbiX family flavin prenyltransferase [Sedimentisphaerales bacterium]|nr:UbiX family flavin prenyltransferase [Sedimentisphaerales bacterium]
MSNHPPQKIILAFSGASGAIYGQRLLDLLEKAGREIHVVATRVARQIFLDEMSVTDFTAQGLLGRASERVTIHDNEDMFSPPASGSFPVDAMVVCPCSSHSVAAIASGLAQTLLQRSAYVSLKQRRPLILVHREMPLSAIDLQNMLTITGAGGIICPASPAFYNEPETINHLVDTVVGRVLDLLNIDHDLPIRWTP